MKARHSRTTKLKRRKEPTAARGRASSAADLQEQLDRRTRELAEALEQQSATSEVLKAMVFMVRLAYGRTSGRPRSRALVGFLFSQFPEKQSGVVTAQDAGSRIIVP